MRFTTVRHGERTHAARVSDTELELLEHADVRAMLAAEGGWRAAAEAPALARVGAEEARRTALVPVPEKVFCVGLNYRAHIEEMGHEPPEYPTLFAKFATALIGDGEPIELPAASTKVDWEAELVIVIGAEVRDGDAEAAAAAIAGFTVGNDVSMRDWQNRTSQFLQGKTFERATPVGPDLVTVDETGLAPDLAIGCAVDGEVRQDSRTGDLVFKPVELVSYISEITTLRPGDLIFTGTPAGVGHGRVPPVYLAEGQTVTTTIEGLGTLVNRCIARR